MVNVTDMIKQAEADLRDAEAASTAAQSRAIAAQADADVARERAREMRAVWEWLQLHNQQGETHTQAERSEQPERAETPPATRFGRPVSEVTQTDLCLRALENLGGTATNKQVRDRLVRDGHNVGLDQVRSTLKYLSRKTSPLVQTDPGSGLWRLRKASTPAPFVPAGTLPMNGTGGES
jgi:hypothetical protein